MSGTDNPHGWGPPDGGESRDEADGQPAHGDQPEPGGQSEPERRNGWDQSSGQGGWQQPGGPSQPGGGEAGWSQPGAQGGWNQPGGQGGWNQPGGQAGWQQPGGYQPPPGGMPGQPGGWATPPGWTWRPPDVKPGVVPLRPLGVGEILDGAVTTIRRNPRVMLGLSAAVAIVTQLIGMLVTWIMLDDVATLEELDETQVTTDEVLEVLASTLGGLGVLLFVTWIGTVFLTGMLTVVVGRAVIGEHLTLGETWAHARPRLPRLFGLTLLYTLIWSGALWAVVILTIVLAADSPEAALAMLFLGGLVAVLLSIWLYVRYSLAAPALMLETQTSGHGPATPIGIRKALSRSSQLVSRSWWRVFGILLLVFLIIALITQVVSIPFSIPALLGDGDMFTVVGMSFGALVLSTLGSVISAMITAPFNAGATALLYVDLRIRREALDLELARAANVELPGRPGHDPGPGQGLGPGGMSPGQ
ncbi:hypothetical protein [Phytoactinopolyspora halotolerans]|uniref:Glycerophosphoryl diester phosphodiesterase membrane domain-containing protein n=1 Tax=Phytoactinopolyspora halotolerans TaxID=1981512 RepID=A0A6L9SCQ4_9ACTN|nr:hypothetical protein [Phytoactinopolyspora halotolerans]NEE02474.1 hypothetical protein [Phytoactinopolyspora halotolerans]